MINKLVIKNFRSIKNVRLSNIKKQLGLIGENSSGKSSILCALLVCLGERDIQSSDFRFNKYGKNEEKIFIGLGIELDYFSLQRLINYNSDENLILNSWLEEIKLDCKGKRQRDTTSKSYTRDFKKSFLSKLDSNASYNLQNLYFGFTINSDGQKLLRLYESNLNQEKQITSSNDVIKGIFDIILPPYAYLRDERGFEKESKGESDSTTNELFSLLLPLINKKSEKVSEDKLDNTPISKLSIPQINNYLLKRIQEEAKDLTESLNTNFKKYYNEEIEVKWIFSNELFKNLNIKTDFCIEGVQNSIDFQSIGSGTRSLYKMALLRTLLERQSEDDEPVLFLLEEPELYLYPKLEQQMENFIYDLSSKNQVIVTTHSPVSIKSFSIDSLYKVERKKETSNAVPVTKVSKLESKSQVTELLGYDITYLLGKDYIIFVEGPDDKRAYECLINKIFGEEKSSKFIAMTTVSKLSAAVSFDFLDQIRSRAKSIYIIDSDGMESEERKNSVVKELTMQDKTINKEELSSKILLTEYCMLECYTFEYRYLKQGINEDEYWNSVNEFLKNKKDDINILLKKRKKTELLDCDMFNVRDNFESVRKYGFNKKLVRAFRSAIGGQGFRSISDLNEDELSTSCKELIDKLKRYFD
ncbi:AAA family ATPase [Streptococcus sanguinis]|uniref:P-loop NTPase n=1 Tax=Streptococcus sanguinis TaxID=1305 RepID=A0A2X3YIQ2_STRSA|nr:AAA family ATPase [Streptococcus sanguinis]SQF70537.1 P-loop NTPase [Streptococcus sanguinis]